MAGMGIRALELARALRGEFDVRLLVANDPAETSDATVRKVYNRSEFERAWLNATGGIVYVIHPGSRPLPANTPGATPNW